MKLRLPESHEALVGRDATMPVTHDHLVLGTSMTPPFEARLEVIYFAMGCFWGAERMMWQVPGVHTTAVGYMGGITKNPSYEEVCSGATGHTETVLVVFDPAQVSVESLLQRFWEGHDPTQGMRQGNDVGTQYRSAIFYTREVHASAVEASRVAYSEALGSAGYGDISTEIVQGGTFYYAEPYHQQYLHRVPNGYCGLGGTGVRMAGGSFCAS